MKVSTKHKRKSIVRLTKCTIFRSIFALFFSTIRETVEKLNKKTPLPPMAVMIGLILPVKIVYTDTKNENKQKHTLR